MGCHSLPGLTQQGLRLLHVMGVSVMSQCL